LGRLVPAKVIALWRLAHHSAVAWCERADCYETLLRASICVRISACPAAGDVSANLAVTSPCARVRDRPSNPSLKTNTHVAFAG
jgi:hypothetical protein